MPRFAVFMLLFSCAAAAQGPARIDDAVYNFPDTLDPHLRFVPEWDRIHRLCYETPLVCSPQSEVLTIVPRLLEAMPTVSEDGLAYRMVFRAGVRFADDACFPDGRGREVRADDFRYSLLRHVDPATASVFWSPYLAGRIVGVDDVRAAAESSRIFDYDVACAGLEIESERVLVIRFTRPYPQFSALLTMSWASIMAREAVGRYGSGLGARTVGTGPYLFDGEASSPEFKVFTPRKGYWRRGGARDDEVLPRNGGVRFHVLADPALHAKRFQDGDLIAVDLLPETLENFVSPKGRPKSGLRPRGLRVLRTGRAWLHYVSFNCRNKLLGKKELRQALCLAVDRDAFIDAYYKGAARAAVHPVPPCIDMNLPKASYPWAYGKRDLKRARELLAKAGFPNGEGLPEFVLDVPADNALARIESEFLRDAWATVGVKVQIRRNVDFAEFLRRARSGLFEIACNYWFADYPDAENFWGMLSTSQIPALESMSDGPNTGYYSNPDYDAIWTESGKLAPGPERGKLYEKLVNIVQEDCPWLFLAHQDSISLVAPGLSGMATRSAYAIDYALIRN